MYLLPFPRFIYSLYHASNAEDRTRKSLVNPCVRSRSNRKQRSSKWPVCPRKNAFRIEADQRSEGGEKRRGGRQFPTLLRSLASTSLFELVHQISKRGVLSMAVTVPFLEPQAWEKSWRVSIRRLETHLCVHHNGHLTSFPFFLLPSLFFYFLLFFHSL